MKYFVVEGKLYIDKKSEDINALFISKKMVIKYKVLQRAKKYIDEKNYNFEIYIELVYNMVN